MKNFPQALAFSVAVHVLVACGLLLCPSLTRIPDAPQMELSAVEFMTAQDTPKSQEAPPEPQEQQEPPVPEPQEQPEPEPQDQQEPEPQEQQEQPEPQEPPEISLPEPPEPQEPPEPPEISLPAAPEPPPEPPRKHPSPTPEAPPPQAAAENTARIDAPPRASRPIRPEYPKEARQRGEEGDVTLDLVITARGLVSEVSVAESSGFRDLDDAAARAAARTKFKPATRGSTPVQANARIIIKFRISGK